MSTDLPLPPAATASSDIRIIVKVIVHEVIVRSRCKMYSDEVQVVIVCRNMEYQYQICLLYYYTYQRLMYTIIIIILS